MVSDMLLRAANELHPGRLITKFCDPSVVAKDFPNGLGKFTPCFTNVAILGVAHTIGVILCLIRIFLSQHSKGAEKYRLSSTARLVHVFAVIVAAANLLLVLFLLNGRIAADTILVVHGHVAPFEWVGFGVSTLSWIVYVVTFFTDLNRYSLQRTWLWRFPLVLIATGQVAQLRFVVLLSDNKDYFFILYSVYVGLNLLLAAFALLHWPGPGQLELVDNAEGYEVLADRQFAGNDKVCPEAKASVFSLVTFGWISGLMRQGYKQPLQFDDIWDLPPDDHVDILSKRFRPIWQEQQERRGGPSLVKFA